METALNVTFSAGLMHEVIKLQSVENGNLGNYTKVDRAVDKLRYRVNDMVMGTVFSELAKTQRHTKIGYSRF